MKAVVVVPAYNEADILQIIFDNFLEVLHPDYDISLLIVDDGSTDQTWPTILDICGNNFEAIRLPRNFGKAVAQRLGIAAALRLGADAVVIMDADGEHPFSEVTKFLNQDPTKNVVIGVRSKYRRSRAQALGVFALRVICLIFGVKFDPSESEFVAFGSDAAKAIVVNSELGAVPLLQSLASITPLARAKRLTFSVTEAFGGDRVTRFGAQQLFEKSIELLTSRPHRSFFIVSTLAAGLVVTASAYGTSIGLSAASRQSGLGSVVVILALLSGVTLVLLEFIALILTAVLVYVRRLTLAEIPKVTDLERTFE